MPGLAETWDKFGEQELRHFLEGISQQVNAQSQCLVIPAVREPGCVSALHFLFEKMDKVWCIYS